MKQVLVKGGGVVVEDVPAPACSPRSVLVRVAHSCVSVGTELSSVQMSGLPLYRRALKQPHHAKKVLEVARDQGVVRTVKRVRGMLAGGLPTGYSAAGTVVAVGDEVAEFSVGDRVACAGGGIANHAEVIDVPVNLAVRIPDGLGTEAAATVTLGAIALQGVRRLQPTLGETVGVLGLGVLGQITAQLLRASGARVVGGDPDQRRVDQARAHGMAAGVGGGDDFVERMLMLTDGFGADGVIVTAATSSSEVMSTALRSCRKRGRVVIVGDVGLDLKRVDLYEKELDVLMSTSYGPGRYDPLYEVEGLDYPIGYVRWTENRNMGEYLRLLGEGRVSLDDLGGATYAVDEAPAAFEALKGADRPLLVLLSYPDRPGEMERTVRLRSIPPREGRVGVALVGAGTFAQAQHVPNLLKLRNRFELRAVMSRTGASAKAVATQAEAAYATTDLDAVLADAAIDLVLVSTRHDSHAEIALRALSAGKHVFVEKPLALTEDELRAIEELYAGAGERPPLLMTGFNRRFSPAVRRLRELLSERTAPLIADYRMNAGFIPADHWVHGHEGGGRNIGEACHVYDVFRSLVRAEPTSVEATGITGGEPRLHANDNFVATIGYADGSVCTLTYTALGSRDFPKERLEVFCDGAVYSLDDYRSLSVTGRRAQGWRSPTMHKGHVEELEELGRALTDGGPWPISLEEQVSATRVSFRVEAALER